MRVTTRHFFWLAVSFIAGFLLPVIAFQATTLLRTEPPRVEETAPEQYLGDEEGVVIPPRNDQEEPIIIPIEKVLFEYIEVAEGCGPHFVGECLNVRTGPGTDYPIVTRLRKGVVLKVGGKAERDGYRWYKIAFSEWIRYPGRVKGSWYVAADYVSALLDEGDRDFLPGSNGSTTKRIVIERGMQRLRAYDGDTLYMETKISTGLLLTPTPRGSFAVYKKTPSRYMQGPIPGIAEEYYDLPGVPWNLYFTQEGAAIHGAYWHDNFGRASSHGCVNLPPDEAKKLYLWADIGTRVIVRD